MTEVVSNQPNLLITRHASNEGSVIKFDTFELFVADAKYRSVQKWSSYDNRTCESSIYFPATQLSDPEIQTKLQAFKEDNSASVNTDSAIKFADSEAAKWCRSQEINGIGPLDLPNLFELAAIYFGADMLDALDPTVDEYPDFALGAKNPNGKFNFKECLGAWSSTEFSPFYSYSISHTDYVHNKKKGEIGGVIPVKKLPPQMRN